MRKITQVIIFNVLLLIALLEIGAFAYFKSGLAVSNYMPSYVNGATKTEPQWMTEFEDWGAWHLPNEVANLQSRCISTDLIANSFGARDKERNLSSNQPRIAVLGDSFVEGYGVSAQDRFTDVLEEKNSKEFLNFGASGNFGPVQYYILYRDLVRKFDHDTVLIAFLPDNDFTDNDPEFWAKDFGKRYRPYFAPTSQGFEVVYGAAKPETTRTFEEMMKGGKSERSLGEKIQRLTWLNGLYRELRYYSKVLDHSAQKTYSGYFDATEQQIQAALFYLKEIRELARDKRVLLFTIPRLGDLYRLKNEESPLINRFSAFAKDNAIEYVDLSQPIFESGQKLENIFIPCDGHWNEKGHELISDILAKQFFNDK